MCPCHQPGSVSSANKTPIDTYWLKKSYSVGNTDNYTRSPTVVIRFIDLTLYQVSSIILTTLELLPIDWSRRGCDQLGGSNSNPGEMDQT